MASDKLIRAGVIFINVSADNLKKADHCIWAAMVHWLDSWSQKVAQQIIPLSSILRVTETGRNEMVWVFSKEELERDDIKMNENEGRKKEDPS